MFIKCDKFFDFKIVKTHFKGLFIMKPVFGANIGGLHACYCYPKWYYKHGRSEVFIKDRHSLNEMLHPILKSGVEYPNR